MKPAIEVTGLSKSYIINHKNKASYNTIKDDFGKLLRHPFRKDGAYDKQEEFWALNDVSFQVKPGEIFGIIGRNGSGKSTMLKILSRIVEPTKGQVTLRGRTASLLEVGTGFNPELTGRENIFFNGSMLGMSRREITKKFNEIVEFSEVEKFLDTPVKFYSSGMYVRLAFSVAAHLEPDILILDEVLAVGDAAFQKKSLNKILETMNEGRTVLFVSHSMGAVQQLCTRGLLLKNGKIDFIGHVDELTDRYTTLMAENAPQYETSYAWEYDEKAANDEFVPRAMYITDANNTIVKKPVDNGIELYLHIEADVVKENPLYNIGYVLKDEHKTLLYMGFESDMPEAKRKKLPKGNVHLRTKIPKHLLNAGLYRASLAVGVYNKYWVFDPETPTPTVEFSISDIDSESKFWKHSRSGLLAPHTDWEIL